MRGFDECMLWIMLLSQSGKELHGVLVSRPSDCSSLRAEVQSRMVQRLFYCGTGFFCIFPFHAVPNPVGEVNNKTCRTVSIMKCAMVGCQH